LDIKSLKPKDKKILAAAMKCGEQRLTLKGIAAEAGVTTKFICDRLKVPEFKQLFIEAMQSSLVAETPAILHTFTQAAKEGSFQHGKLVLELTGVHQEKQKVDLTAKMEVQDSLFKSDEERREFMRDTLKGIINSEEGE